MEFQEAIKLKKLCKEICVLFLFQQFKKTANGNLVPKLWYTTKSKTKKHHGNLHKFYKIARLENLITLFYLGKVALNRKLCNSN